MIGDLDAAIRDEKLRPPRALVAIGTGLYGPPLAPSTRAYVAWINTKWSTSRGALDAMIAQARRDDAQSLEIGGPPGNYVVSGVAMSDHLSRVWLEQCGFRERGQCFDL